MAGGGFSQSAHAHAHRGGSLMAFVRSIGRWSLTALVINAFVGASIFGLLGNHSVSRACESAHCAFGSLSRLPGRVVSK
jgi:hypothetical protein